MHLKFRIWSFAQSHLLGEQNYFITYSVMTNWFITINAIFEQLTTIHPALIDLFLLVVFRPKCIQKPYSNDYFMKIALVSL